MKIAIIGGSGFEDPDILKDSEDYQVETPYGDPSSAFKTGELAGQRVVVLSRHGREHDIPPSQVNNRANIWAIQKLECTHIIATTACGSLREEIGRGDLIIPDQFIDFTRHRKISFFEKFEEGKLRHISVADPFDPGLRQKIIESAVTLSLPLHPKGTVITIEGPRFSTRAESNMFRSWGADVINMSLAPECILANELGIPYVAVALCTDYDCWKTDEKSVTWEEVLGVFEQNVYRVTTLIKHVVSGFQ